MIKAQASQLLIILLLFSTEESHGRKTEGERERKKYILTEEKTARSALIGIKPEDVAMSGNTGDDSGSRKSEVNLLDQLPALRDEQRLTNSALDYSNHLSPLDQRLVKQFDKANAGNSGNHDDSSLASTLQEGEVDKNVNRNSRNFVEQVTRDGMGRTEFNPETVLKEDISTFRSGELDKDFYHQISQIEGDQPQASDVGKINDMYKNNPLPEYSYKESDYGEVSDHHSNDGGYDKYYKNNPFEMPKNPFEMPKRPLETPKNEYELDTQDKELFQGYSNDQQQHAGSPSDNSDLYSMIGKKVVLDMLKQRNESQEQSEESIKQNFLKKLLGGNSDQNDMGVDKLLVNKMTTTTSPNQLITHLPTLPSQGNVLTSRRLPLKEALSLGAQQTTPLNLPKGINLSIQGHVFQGDPLAPSRMIKEQSPTARKQSPAAVELQNKLNNFQMESDRTPLNNHLQSKEEDSKKENYVTLKISGAGKPVSFKAGTSNDGSLVLKIPGNVTLVDPATNRDISAQATLNENEKDMLKTKMATVAEQMNRYLWETQTNPTQEFAKKGNTIEGNNNNQNKEMLSWQILGKTNAELNQDEMEHSEARDILQDDLKVMSPVRPTSGQAAFLPPTAIHDLSQTAPTKYNELSRVSFAGVGKSPPSELFPPSLKVRQNVENNKLLPLKSFLRPSKFLEDSAMNRGRLSVGPVQYVPTNGIMGLEKERNSWSPCSVTCGEGIQARARLCEGTQCKGYRTESKACFMQACPEQLGRAGLRLHNKFRAWHKSSPLKWSNRLADKAQRIAKEMADKSTRLADMETEYSGINIAELWHSYDIASEKATAQWYSEVKSYDFEDPEISGSNKHFTQLIWKGSKKVGIGEAKSADGKHTFVVALYDPPGNIRTKERSNVHMPESPN